MMDCIAGEKPNAGNKENPTPTPSPRKSQDSDRDQQRADVAVMDSVAKCQHADRRSSGDG